MGPNIEQQRSVTNDAIIILKFSDSGNQGPLFPFSTVRQLPPPSSAYGPPGPFRIIIHQSSVSLTSDAQYSSVVWQTGG